MYFQFASKENVHSSAISAHPRYSSSNCFTHLSTAFTGALLAVLLSVPLLGFSALSMAAELLNINSADVETIASSLNGIGPAKAQAIVDYREQNGTFQALEDLTNVPGIGETTLDQIKSMITIGDSPSVD